jgi:hypothetical protein
MSKLDVPKFRILNTLLASSLYLCNELQSADLVNELKIHDISDLGEEFGQSEKGV